MNIMEEALKIKDEIIKWRRELHKIPEISIDLPKTNEYIRKKLDDMDINYTVYKNHSGIVALFGKREGKTIAIRADMDGLEIKEEVESCFKSQNNNMHACGHDGHMAILLGVAKILKENESKINGKIKLLFQAGEECEPSGALALIENGALDNPKVDAILALHLDNKPGSYKNGDVIVKYGYMSASEDSINIKIIGRGGHGSSPHLCIDPISIATLVINNIQYILSREIKSTIPTVISFGSIHGGNNSRNIIPDIVEIRGTIRNTDLDTREFVLKRIEEIVEGITKIMRADFEISFDSACPAVNNDDNMVDRFLKSSKKILKEDQIHVTQEPWLASEDAGFLFEKVPGCFFRLHASKVYEDGIVYPLHNSKFDIDDSVLYIGTVLFLQNAIDYLNTR